MGKTKSGLSVEVAGSPYYVYSLLMKIGRKPKHDEAMGFTQPQEKEGKKNPTIPKTWLIGDFGLHLASWFSCSKWLEICGFLDF